jgi:hypothetical protein
MLPIRLSTSLLLLPLLLHGCGADDVGAPAAPSQQHSKAQNASTYLITEKAAGAVQLGMSSADILSVLPGITATSEKDGEGIEWMTVSQNGEKLMNIMLDRSDHTANLIRVISPRFVTEQGVKVGENLQSVGEKLGGLTEIQWTEIESREFATFTNAPVTMIFQVMGKDGTAGIYPNGETITTAATSSASIHSIWLMED